MSDIIIEVLRVVPVISIFSYLVITGRRSPLRKEAGWRYILTGFGLILFANIIDVTDNFDSLNKFVVIGDTEIQAFLEKVVGYLGGFIFLAIGFWKWLPKIISLSQTRQELEASQENLRKLNSTLEKKVQERTKELKKSELKLKNHVDELKQFNKIATGRELAMIKLKKENTKLKKKTK